jgi:glyoxylase-like metal-dependent hydrolase (beta-lactamase superfamily II)
VERSVEMPRAPYPTVLLCVGLVAGACAPLAGAELAPGVELIPGAFEPGTQPDGNTVILRGPGGLVVVDTGRHAAHTERIVEHARAVGLPVSVVVNTHWHLDHVGGNPAVRRAFPRATVLASGAIDGALVGFLARYRDQLESLIAGAASPAAARPFRDELAILDAAPGLVPDQVVEATAVRSLAGREVEVHLETHAVTAGDVWLLDRASGVLIAGDLVTLPAPFFDTACPRRWQQVLGVLEAQELSWLVPGHGPPMTRADVAAYRGAFDSLLGCAASTRPKEECAEGWLGALGGLVPEAERDLARALLGYYLDARLRAPAEVSAADCGD